MARALPWMRAIQRLQHQVGQRRHGQAGTEGIGSINAHFEYM
jgi:hypothetical protein